MLLQKNMFEQRLLSYYNITKSDIHELLPVLKSENTGSSSSNNNKPDAVVPVSENMGSSSANSDVYFDNATKQVLETGSLTPLLKEELKYKIQSRRVAEGKRELKVEFLPPAENKLTPEEEIKVQKRKLQNRVAAKKFRQKQKDVAFNLKKTIQSLESGNTRLRSEIKRLQNEKNELQQKLQQHLMVCPYARSVT